MKKLLLSLFFFLLMTSFYFGDGATIVLAIDKSPNAVQRREAIADFKKGEFTVAYSHCGSNAYYVEEIFYKRYNLKIEMARFDMGCIIPAPETLEDEKSACYYQTIDSLLFRKLGDHIYGDVQWSADSFALAAPHRYDCQPLETPVYIPCNDSMYPNLRKVLRYPTQDDIEGVVCVRVLIDTAGDVDSTIVMRGARHDLDSAAQAGIKHLGKFTPVRRWGIPKDGQFTVPIKFARN